MSPKSIINFLQKTALVFALLGMLMLLLNLVIGIRGIVIGQSPVRGYQAPGGISVAFNVKGLWIEVERNHKSVFYSKDKSIRIREKPDYMIQVEARSFFYCLSLFMKTVEIGMITAIFWYFMRLLRQINLQDPFDRKLVKHLKTLAFIFIAMDVLKLLQNLSYGVFLSRSFSYTSIQTEMLYSIGGNLITGLTIWIIAIVFERGIELQDENALTV